MKDADSILFCCVVLVPDISWPRSNCAIMRVSRHFCGGIADWTDQQRRCVSRRAASDRHFFSAGKGALGDVSQWGDRLPCSTHLLSSVVFAQLWFMVVLFSDTASVRKGFYPL
jgi:hypothetical protein